MRVSPLLLVVLGGPLVANNLVLVALAADNVPCAPAWLWGSAAVTLAYATAVVICGRRQSRGR